MDMNIVFLSVFFHFSFTHKLCSSNSLKTHCHREKCVQWKPVGQVKVNISSVLLSGICDMNSVINEHTYFITADRNLFQASVELELRPPEVPGVSCTSRLRWGVDLKRACTLKEAPPPSTHLGFRSAAGLLIMELLSDLSKWTSRFGWVDFGTKRLLFYKNLQRNAQKTRSKVYCHRREFRGKHSTSQKDWIRMKDNIQRKQQ